MLSPVTFTLIKPASVGRGHTFDILKQITEQGFSVERIRHQNQCRTTMSALYAEHQGRPYFDGLIDFMSSGSIVALIVKVKGEEIDAIARFRDLIGATKSAEAKPGTLRHAFGGHKWNPNAPIADNAVHASDSITAVNREAKLFFPDFDISEYVSQG